MERSKHKYPPPRVGRLPILNPQSHPSHPPPHSSNPPSMSTTLGDSRLNENSKWTPEEDAVLVEAVSACEPPSDLLSSRGLLKLDLAGSRRCWNTIAQSLPGRTNKSCRKRWIHSLDPSLRKGVSTSGTSVPGGVLNRLSSRSLDERRGHPAHPSCKAVRTSMAQSR